MAPHVGQQEPPEDSAEQRASSELVKRIRKLRWMGMEREAEALQATLCRRARSTDSVLAAPHDTD
jgi:hypothetical protein